jgi:hypothetical protein
LLPCRSSFSRLCVYVSAPTAAVTGGSRPEERVVVDDPAPEQVADLRREAVDRLLTAVEREREMLPIGQPEIDVEPAF